MAEHDDTTGAGKDEPGTVPDLPKSGPGVPPANKQKIPGKLVAAGCIGLALMCCLCSGLGMLLQAAEKRQKCGPPAIARGLAEHNRELARGWQQQIGQIAPGPERQHGKAFIDAVLREAEQFERVADSLSEQDTLDRLYALHCAEMDRLGADLRAVLATYPASDTNGRARIQKEIDEPTMSRERFSLQVNDKRRELEKKYQEERQARQRHSGGTTRLFEPGPTGADGSTSGTGNDDAAVGPKPENSPWDGGVHCIEVYVREHAHDPASVEFAAWSEVTSLNTAAHGRVWAVRADYRAKNKLGALVLESRIFYIRNGAVVGSEPYGK